MKGSESCLAVPFACNGERWRAMRAARWCNHSLENLQPSTLIPAPLLSLELRVCSCLNAEIPQNFHRKKISTLPNRLLIITGTLLPQRCFIHWYYFFPSHLTENCQNLCWFFLQDHYENLCHLLASWKKFESIESHVFKQSSWIQVHIYKYCVCVHCTGRHIHSFWNNITPC